jgi:hypothetical protein
MTLRRTPALTTGIKIFAIAFVIAIYSSDLWAVGVDAASIKQWLLQQQQIKPKITIIFPC